MRAAVSVRFLCALIVAVSAAALAMEEEKVSNQSLIFCVSSYREGFYQKSIDCINEVFPRLNTGSDSLTAFEYLALSYGMLNQIDLSRQNFRLALRLNPRMEIDTLEFPPNISLIFGQVKMEVEKARQDSAAAAAMVIPPEQSRNVVLPVVLLTAGIGAAGAGGYFFYNSHRSYQNYQSATDQPLIDGYYSKYRTSLVEGAVCSGAAAVAVPVSLYLLLRKTPARKKTSLVNDNGRLLFTLRF